jgi:hypothetical protein
MAVQGFLVEKHDKQMEQNLFIACRKRYGCMIYQNLTLKR